METIAQISRNLVRLLGRQAEQTGIEMGIIQRQRKFSARSLLQTLVWGFQSNPTASYTDLAISAASVGVEISPQGIEQRFTEKTGKFLKQMIAESMKLTIEQQQPKAANLLERFEGVYIQDSTIVSLPVELSEIWEGLGSKKGPTAAVKLQTQWEYKSAQLVGLTIQNGKEQDQASPYQYRALPKNALRIEDLGYFSIKRMENDHENGVYWVSRLRTGTKVYDEHGQALDLIDKLRRTRHEQLCLKIQLGRQKKIPCRLLILRAPPEVTAERLRKLRRKASKAGRSVSDRQKIFAQWTLLITNVPEELLSFDEVFVVYRVRWQIELLFKLWKTHFKLNAWRSQNKWRILCEFYAKLLGTIISHWLFMAMGYFPQRSLFKAAAVIRCYSFLIAFCLHDLNLLINVIAHMVSCFRSACRTNSRQAKPATYQLLSNPMPLT